MPQHLKRAITNLEDQKSSALAHILKISQPVTTHDAHGSVKTVWSRVGVNTVADALQCSKARAKLVLDSLAEDKLVIRLYRRDHTLQVQLKG